jgi:multiple sugar transport system ATP-binding protein
MANVELKKINKYFGETHILHDIDLVINDGEFVVLVGPSGCGKSTTLRIVAGLEDASSGDLMIQGNRMNEVEPKDRDIAMVFQNYALYPHMDVYENMAFGLRLRKFDDAEIATRVDEAAELLGITDLLKRKPKELSGGQRQRVAVGRAIVRKPSVFLFDEPLSNLDAKLRVQMRTEIKKLHARLKTTMIYVTHDQVEAMTMGDRIVVMKDGDIMQAETPLNMYHKPANKFVAGFIGSPSMNFFNLSAVEKGNEKLDGSSMSLHVPSDLSARVQKEGLVEIGVRPEHFKVSQTETPFVAELEVSELMGNESYLYLNSKGYQFVIRIQESIILTPGSPVYLDFDMDKVHLFSGKTGARI